MLGVAILYKYVDQKGLIVLLAIKRSAYVTPQVQLRRGSIQARNLPWLWNLGQTLPEVQNRGITDSTKRNDVLQKFFKENEAFIVYFIS